MRMGIKDFLPYVQLALPFDKAAVLSYVEGRITHTGNTYEEEQGKTAAGKHGRQTGQKNHHRAWELRLYRTV